jgi:hypothetical protein
MLSGATIWQLATPHGDIDVLHDAPGAAPYDKLRERALVIALDDPSVTEGSVIAFVPRSRRMARCSSSAPICRSGCR